MKIEHTYPFFHQHKHSPRKIENSNKMFALLLSSFLVSSKYFHAMNRFQFYELFGQKRVSSVGKQMPQMFTLITESNDTVEIHSNTMTLV